MNLPNLPQTDLITALVFAAVFIFILAAFVAMRRRSEYRGKVESRLLAAERTGVQTHAELIQIRRSRSLSPDGHYLLPMVSLNRLILQSGTRLGFSWLFTLMGVSAIAGFAAGQAAGLGSVLAVLGGGAAGVAAPLVVLRSMRDARRRRFEEQLPDALDTLVRSLRAGHSLAVAIAAVGRHLPDPIGAEFRLTAAEVTYGLDLETGMVNLSARVGQPDLALVVLAVSIQSKTGGNLAEVLGNLSRVVRERLKLRRRAHALSAEGRFSAVLLSCLPVVLFAVLKLISPNYYGDVWANPYVKPALGGAVFWMLLGDYVMYRMVRIRV